MDSGRVEVYLDELWGTVNAGVSDDQQKGTAQTICRQLGYDNSDYYGTVSKLR